MSSFQLVNTITPLASGILIPRFGVGRASIAATGVVALGLGIVCWQERGGVAEGNEKVGGMILGLFIFGLGISPLAVVQESIILRTNSLTSKSVARTLSAGLLLGKAVGFSFRNCISRINH